MKKIIISFMSIVTILSLFACGVNNKYKYTVMETAAPQYFAGANGFARTNASMKMMDLVEDAVYAEADESGSYEPNPSKKLIKNVDLNTETKDFDAAIDWLKSYIDECKGIIDNSYIDSGNMASGSSYRKSANFSVRIPVDTADSFLSKVGDKLNVTFHQENVRDVTDTYNDTEGRLKTLNLEEEKLNELLSKAKTVEDLIKIEEKLSEVRAEIANITYKLKRFDKQIDYTTFNISVNEVVDLTEFVPKEDLSKENLIKQLNKNFEATKKFVINAGVYLFVHIPAICLGLIAIVAILIIILIIRTAGKSVKTKKSNKNKETNKEKKSDNKNN